MALIRGPYGTSQIKGSIGPTTFQQSRFGLVARTRTVPVNPATPKQSQIRQGFAAASSSWANESQANRDAWEFYAANTSWLNKLGETVFLTGRQCYIRVFSFLFNTLNVTFPLAAPTFPGLLNSGTPAFDRTGSVITLTGVADLATTMVLGAVQFDGPFQPTKNFFKGPYSDYAPFLTADLPVTLRTDAAAGQRYFWRFRTFYDINALSPAITGTFDT